MMGGHCIKSWSASQGAYALSTAEAEFYGLVIASSRGIGTMSLLKDFGVDQLGELSLRFSCDSSLAIAVATARLGT